MSLAAAHGFFLCSSYLLLKILTVEDSLMTDGIIKPNTWCKQKEAAKWFQANCLSLNVSKAKYIVFRNRNMHFVCIFFTDMYIYGENV